MARICQRAIGSDSKDYFEPELNLAGRTCLQDLPEKGIGDNKGAKENTVYKLAGLTVGLAEIDVIEQVEEFGPKLHIYPLVFSHVGVLQDGEVEIHQAGAFEAVSGERARLKEEVVE